MEGLILLALIGITWLTSPRRWRRQVVLPAAIGVLLYLGLTSPIGLSVASQGLTATLPRDAGDASDAIVVLGRGSELRNRRAEVTEDLWQAKRAPKIFASGMLDAEFIMEQLQAKGLPKTALSGEKCSQTTAENALFTAALLGRTGMKKVILLTDPYHMQRAIAEFRRVGFEVSPQLSPLPPQLSAGEQLRLMLREYGGLVKSAVLAWFHPRPVPDLQQPETWVTQRIREWKCQL